MSSSPVDLYDCEASCQLTYSKGLIVAKLEELVGKLGIIDPSPAVKREISQDFLELYDLVINFRELANWKYREYCERYAVEVHQFARGLEAEVKLAVLKFTSSLKFGGTQLSSKLNS
jgi:hypothetical protein